MADVPGAGPVDQTAILEMIRAANANVQKLMADMKAGGSTSAGDIGMMMQLQMAMNALSQMVEGGSAVISASNSAVMSVARGVKG